MLRSVLQHDSAHVRFLHGDDWPADYFDRLRGMIEDNGGTVTFLHVPPERLTGLRTREGLPAAHWYRIFLPELLPDVDRVLYLDGDLIALESLAPLWSTNLGDNYLGAVTNVFQSDHLNRPHELGLSEPSSYFNSGVLLMDLAAMRRDGCTEEVTRVAR